ncbi:hypothetical protein R1flu_012335 [Riccia fluitans]|uniref:Uncharacterized protein n=1 Tax=Riccia fluitans TaxID=41844 RepID=A0ABD1ZBG8_9MARC
MIRSGQYIPGFRWLTTAKISRLRAERIWRACTSPKSMEVQDVEVQDVEVPDVEAIFFGVETTARYFKTQEQKTSAGDQDANIDEDQDADDDGELTRNDCQSRPGHDQQASTIPVKQQNPMDHLPDYFRLWD